MTSPALEKFSAPRLRHEVDALGRSTGENYFVRARRAEIIGDDLPRVLVGVGRTRTQFVQAAMHIGVVVLVVMPEGIDHRTRLLRGGRVVEIDQGLAVYRFAQDREILTDCGPVDGSAENFVHHLICDGSRGSPLHFAPCGRPRRNFDAPRYIQSLLQLDFGFG